MVVPKINSAHGSETRNIINRVIDVLNQLGINVQHLVAEGQLTPDQYATLIKTVNGLVARGEITLNDLSSEVLEKINESNPEFNLLSIPRDKSVIPHKTNFIEIVSDNKYNPDDVLQNSQISASGAITQVSSRVVSHIIPVVPTNQYTFSGVAQYAYYDDTLKFISLNTANSPETITVPSGVFNVRLVIANSQVQTVRFNHGGALLPFDRYEIALKNQSSVLDDLMAEENESWVI